jgi:nucleotide-binding universal stress UspA family protein
MDRFRNTLYISHGLPDGTAALRRAVEVAAFDNAALSAVAVHPPLPAFLNTHSERHGQDLRDKLSEELNNGCASLGVSLQQPVGAELGRRPARKIVRRVLENGHDLVIKPVGAPHGRGFRSLDMNLLREMQRQDRAALQELASTCGFGGQFRIDHLSGSPRERIPEYVQEKHVNLLVMGTVARTGIAGFVIGNTAEDVLQKISCSLLTAKPSGFKSPIAH